LDELDKKIIKILLKNARTSFTEIARALNVSEATIRKRIKKLEEKGVIKGLDDSLYKVEKKLDNLKETAYKIHKDLEKQKENLEETFKKYQWSWLGPFLLVSILLGLGIIYIGLQNAGKEKASETLIGLLKVSFILFSIFIAWEIFKRFISKLWISITLVSLLFIESFLITFTTLKGKIQIVHKQVCNLPKPNEVVPQKDGSTCYLYENQKPYSVYWHSPQEDKWYQTDDIAVCTSSK